MARLPRTATLAFAVVALLLSGCTGDESPAASTTTPTPSTGSPGGTTPTPVASTTPASPGGTPAATTPAAAAVKVVRVAADRGLVEPGEPVLVTIELRNDGGRPGAGSVAVMIDGQPSATSAFHVEPGATQTLTLTLTLEEPGAHLVSFFAEGATVSVNPIEISVVDAGALEVSGLTVSPPSVDLGDPAVARLTVTNRGGTQGTGAVQLRWNGTLVGSANVDLAPGQSTNLTITVSPPRGGTGILRATVASGSADATATLTVRAPRLANAQGTYVDEFCQGRVSYRVDFDNVGDGVARGLVATAVVLHPNGTEVSRQDFPGGEVIPGARHSITVAPAVPDQCGVQERYSIRVTVAPRHGDPITVEGGPFTLE